MQDSAKIISLRAPIGERVADTIVDITENGFAALPLSAMFTEGGPNQWLTSFCTTAFAAAGFYEGRPTEVYGQFSEMPRDEGEVLSPQYFTGLNMMRWRFENLAHKGRNHKPEIETVSVDAHEWTRPHYDLSLERAVHDRRLAGMVGRDNVRRFLDIYLAATGFDRIRVPVIGNAGGEDPVVRLIMYNHALEGFESPFRFLEGTDPPWGMPVVPCEPLPGADHLSDVLFVPKDP